MKINLLSFKKSTLFILYIIGFIFAFTTSVPAYINSSFIESLTSEQAVGLFFSAGAIFSLVALIYIPKLLKKFGNYKVTLYLSVLYFFNFLGLALFQNLFLILLCFLLTGAIASIIYFNFDIFVEHNSNDRVTGGIRSIYLTCINLAWLFSPWIAGVIVEKYSFRITYFVSALIMIPIIFIIKKNLKNFVDPEYKLFNIIKTIKSVYVQKNIRNIITCGFLLNFFYSWMVIYGTIYLYKYVGFDFITGGIIFSIALLPFVLIQIPLGYIADKKYGEKEILTIGFIIMGIATAIMPLIHNKSVIIWTLMIFIGRVGAATVEIMNDTYFFKQINDKNLNVINLYRVASASASVVAPIIAIILLTFIPFNGIFYILGLLMIFAVRYSLALKDTKLNLQKENLT